MNCVGWREWISLPDLGIPLIKAKCDTGARTSALHAVDQHVFEKDGESIVHFAIPASSHHGQLSCECRVHDLRDIKNTSGVPERRVIIQTLLALGNRRWPIEVSLADREQMRFDIILGRTALKDQGLLVDPSRSFLAGKPT
jgi:hypothetical protein